MQRPTRDTVVALLVGGAIAAGLYWLGGRVGLAVMTGACWASGLKLALHVGYLYPAYATGETWADKRWTGLSVGLVTLAALVGAGPLLSSSNVLRIGLWFLVTGAGFVGYTAGTIAVLERLEDGSNATPSKPGSTRASDGD